MVDKRSAPGVDSFVTAAYCADIGTVVWGQGRIRHWRGAAHEGPNIYGLAYLIE